MDVPIAVAGQRLQRGAVGEVFNKEPLLVRATVRPAETHLRQRHKLQSSLAERSTRLVGRKRPNDCGSTCSTFVNPSGPLVSRQ